MNKTDFLDGLKSRLSGLPENDINEHLDFYAEMIDDRIEDGLSEEEAISQIGSTDNIVSQILENYPLSKIVKEKVKPKRKLAAWEIILLVLGAPLWIPLAGSAASVILTLIISLLAIFLSLWVVDAGLLAGFIGGIFTSVVLIIRGNILSGVLTVGAALVCAGLSVFMFFACKAITKCILSGLKKAAVKIKSHFVGKENKK